MFNPVNGLQTRVGDGCRSSFQASASAALAHSFHIPAYTHLSSQNQVFQVQKNPSFINLVLEAIGEQRHIIQSSQKPAPLPKTSPDNMQLAGT
jgi:hypothetical protein